MRKSHVFWNRVFFSDESKLYSEKNGKNLVRIRDGEDRNDPVFKHEY
jgi:hypothetical protein